MPFAAIYVPEFPVEAVVRAEPELRELAIAVVEGTPPLVRVIAVNDKAGDLGVEPGMTKVQAAERIPEGQVRRRSPEQESAAHAALLDCACGFSPRVEETANDTILLDLTGMDRVFGPPAKIAQEISRRCSELLLQANVAVASNPDAAMHAARGFPGVTVISEGKEAERLGNLPVEVLLQSLNKCAEADLRPALPESKTRARTNPTRLEETGLYDPDRAAELLETLERWGIRNFRALAALPEVAVTERLGQEGLRLQRMSRGATKRLLDVADPPLKFEEAIELEYPIENLEPLAFVLNRMLEQLCARLAARTMATHELRLKMQLDTAVSDESDAECRVGNQPSAVGHREAGNGEQPNENYKLQIANYQSAEPSINHRPSAIFERTLRLPVAMLDAKVFLKLLQLDLKSHPPGAPVVKIWLAAEPALPRVAQHGLFLPQAPEPEKLELTLAKIAQVVRRGQPKVCGDGSLNRPARVKDRGLHIPDEPRVGSPELLDTHRPDAFRMQRFSPPPANYEQKPAVHAAAITALRRFRPPLKVRITLHEGQPQSLSCAERPDLLGEVLWAAGPWCGSGDWWSEQPWATEEWDIAVQALGGVAIYRLHRDALKDVWFLEGTYD